MSVVANPQHPHRPTVLVVDSSASMDDEMIGQVNDALRFVRDDLSSDDLARKRIELSVVSFGPEVQTVVPFCSIDEFEPPILLARGLAPMGRALAHAMESIRTRTSEYRRVGIDSLMPFLVVISAGEPTDMHVGDAAWESVVGELHSREPNGDFMLFVVPVQGANKQLLEELAPSWRAPVYFNPFRLGMFNNLFDSLNVVTYSTGSTTELEAPVGGFGGWSELGIDGPTAD